MRELSKITNHEDKMRELSNIIITVFIINIIALSSYGSNGEKSLEDISQSLKSINDKLKTHTTNINDLGNMKQKIKDDVITPLEKEVISLDQNILSQKNSFHRLRLNGGAISLNPFAIKPEDGGTFTIDNGSETTKAFIELAYLNRWAWNAEDDRENEHFSLLDVLHGNNKKENLKEFLAPDGHVLRLGFVIGKDDEVSASTIVGSGDVFGEASINWNLVRYPTGSFANSSFNFETILGGVTDRGVNDIHDRQGVGFSWVKRTKNDHRFFARLSYNRMETPELDRSDDSKLIVKSSNGDPNFVTKWGVGFETEFYVRTSPDVENFLVIGGKFFGAGELDPNPWTVWIAYSMPISNLAKLLPIPDILTEKTKKTGK